MAFRKRCEFPPQIGTLWWSACYPEVKLREKKQESNRIKQINLQGSSASPQKVQQISALFQAGEIPAQGCKASIKKNIKCSLKEQLLKSSVIRPWPPGEFSLPLAVPCSHMKNLSHGQPPSSLWHGPTLFSPRRDRTASRFSWASVHSGRSSKDLSNSISARRHFFRADQMAPRPL